MRLGLDCEEQEKQRRGGGLTTRALGAGRKGSLQGLLPSAAGGASAGSGSGISSSGKGKRRRANSISSVSTHGKGMRDEGETGSLLDGDEVGSTGTGGSSSSSRRQAPKAARRHYQQQQGQGKGAAVLVSWPEAPAAGAGSSSSSSSSTGPRSVASGQTSSACSESTLSSFSGLAGLGQGVGAAYNLVCLNVSPTQVLMDAFARLHAQGRVNRGKTLAVM